MKQRCAYTEWMYVQKKLDAMNGVFLWMRGWMKQLILSEEEPSDKEDKMAKAVEHTVVNI